MPVTSTWTSPAAAGALDLATGAVINETWVDAIASNFLYLAGTTGAITQIVGYTGLLGAGTTSASLAAIPSVITPSMTTQTSSKVLVFWCIGLSINSAGQIGTIGVQQDSAGYLASGRFHAPVSGYVETISGISLFTPTAAAHTWNLGWSVGVGFTLTQDSGMYTTLIAVEIRR